MKVQGIRWVGTCTDQFEATAAFFRDSLGLAIAKEGVSVVQPEFSRFVQFRLPNGELLEVLTGDEAVRERYKAPLIAFLVDDVEEARRELEERGVVFLGPIHRAESEGWSYFRAPDSHLYLIQGALHGSAQ